MTIGDSRHPVICHDQINRAADRYHAAQRTGKRLGVVECFIRRVQAVHAFGCARRVCQGADFRGVAADHGGPRRLDQRTSRCGAIGRGATAHGVKHDGNATAGSQLRRLQHGRHPRAAQGADVDDQRPRQGDHRFDFLGGMRHHRRGANRQQGIGRAVHHHIIGNVVNQRCLRPDSGKIVLAHGALSGCGLAISVDVQRQAKRPVAAGAFMRLIFRSAAPGGRKIVAG